jgi:hypothetical protein
LIGKFRPETVVRTPSLESVIWGCAVTEEAAIKRNKVQIGNAANRRDIRHLHNRPDRAGGITPSSGPNGEHR